MEIIAINNYDNGEDVQLTQKQMLGILVKLNSSKSYSTPKFTETKFGKVYLN